MAVNGDVWHPLADVVISGKDDAMSAKAAIEQVQFWGEMLQLAKQAHPDDELPVPYWQSLYDKGCAILAEHGISLTEMREPFTG